MGNTLFDFTLNKMLGYSYELFHFKNEIKPIWIVNEMAGGKSGCMMWPGKLIGEIFTSFLIMDPHPIQEVITITMVSAAPTTYTSI